MRETFAWGMGHGAWRITVQVSGHALAHYGAMPHAPCDKTLGGPQYEPNNKTGNQIRGNILWLTLGKG